MRERPVRFFGARASRPHMLMLLATIFWASATVVSRTIMTALTPLQLAMISSWLTVPIHVLIAMKGLPQAVERLSSPAYLFAVIYSGVFSTGIAVFVVLFVWLGRAGTVRD